MRETSRLFPLGLVAALVLLLAACQAGSGGDQTSSPPAADQAADRDGEASAPLVSSATDVLGASAERFQQEVESLRAEMAFSVELGDFSVEATADMAFQAPDRMHMTMGFSDATGIVPGLSSLGPFEMLMLGSDIYMNMPPQGWVEMSLEDLGVDAQTFRDLASNRSFLDYQQIVQGLGADIQDLGEETMDGAGYLHYRATLDFADLLGAFSDAFGTTDALPVDQLSGPLTLDVWVDPDTLLPHRLNVSGTFGLGEEQSMGFAAEMRFLEYNGTVEIPEAPADAVPFDMSSGL